MKGRSIAETRKLVLQIFEEVDGSAHQAEFGRLLRDLNAMSARCRGYREASEEVKNIDARAILPIAESDKFLKRANDLIAKIKEDSQIAARNQAFAYGQNAVGN